MNSTDIKDYVVAILTKSKRLDEVPLEHIEEVERVLQKMATAGGGGIAGMPDDGAGAGVVKFEEEVVKIDDKGQWSIEKAIKPGPTLNYKEINKPVNTEDNPANTINYKEMNRPKHMDKPKNTIDYKQVNSANPDAENAAREAKHKAKQNTMVGGSPEKDAAQAELARRRAAIRSSGSGTPVKPAMETIKERADKKKT